MESQDFSTLPLGSFVKGETHFLLDPCNILLMLAVGGIRSAEYARNKHVKQKTHLLYSTS